MAAMLHRPPPSAGSGNHPAAFPDAQETDFAPGLPLPAYGARPVRALVIDDDDDDARLLERRLEQCAPGGAAFALRRAGTLAEAAAALTKGDVEIVFLDVRLPDGCGLAFLGRLRRLPAPPPVIIYSGCQERDICERALKGGAAAYLHKDLLDLLSFRRSVARALPR